MNATILKENLERDFQNFLTEAKAKIKLELAKLEQEVKSFLSSEHHAALAEKMAAAGQAVDVHLATQSTPQAAEPVQEAKEASRDASGTEMNSPSPESQDPQS